jgi:hypothetical protein
MQVNAYVIVGLIVQTDHRTKVFNTTDLLGIEMPYVTIQLLS